MWVRQVRLTDFRSYPSLDIGLELGVTTFVGANGQGKTNLVEAIGYASVLASHRVATDAPLVRTGADRAVIAVEVVTDDRSRLIELELNPGRANRARLNKSPVGRPREIVGLLRTVLFAPEDLALVKGEPSERRRFLDTLLVQRSPRLHATKTDVDRIVKQRNALLRTAPDSAALSVWDEQLAAAGGELISARVQFVRALAPRFAAAYAFLSSDPQADAGLAYVSSAVGETTDTPDDADSWQALILAALSDRRREELARALTVVGPHRDDVSISLGGGPAKGFASHGESWSLALALRLAALDVLCADGQDPVLILDDVFAELDSARRERLAERVAESPQVLITAAVEQDVPTRLGGSRMMVTSGSIAAGRTSR